MTFMNMRPARALSDQMIFAVGQVVIPATATTINTQVLPANLSVGSYGTSQLTPTVTISPQGNRLPIFLNPDPAQAPNAANVNPLPRGLNPTPTGTLGSEILIDCSGIPSDIVFADANLYRNSRGLNNAVAVVSAVDNVNKLVYIQITNAAGSAALAAPSGSIVAFELAFRDSFTP